MDKSSDEYHLSFFTPTTPQAKANRNMVVWLVLIWFFAIFGFQILLRVIEKPTPEATYTSFQNVWPNIESGSPTPDQLQVFGRASLSVLGKLAILPDDKIALDNALSWTILQLTEDSQKSDVVASIKTFEKTKAEIEDISNQAYLDAKESLSAQFGPLLKISALDVRSKILPMELTSESISNMTDNTRKNLPGIMKKYLVHNQSFLTDLKFLGFPFHYFYTAFFLLVLFVSLCLLYCVKTDSINARFNIVD